MSRMRPRLLGGLLVACIACGTIELPPGETAPVNACPGGSTTCADVYPSKVKPVCEEGTCIVKSIFVPILAVSIPGTNVFGPGRTVLLPTMPKPLANCLIDCVPVPPLGTFDGYVDVDSILGSELAPPNGLRPNVPLAGFTSLPVTARFHPLYLDPASQQRYDAVTFGLPAPDVVSVQTRPVFIQPAPTNGTDPNGNGVGFQARVPAGLQTDGLGLYDLEILPDPPYQQFPPILIPFGVIGDGARGFHLTDNPDATHSFAFTVEPEVGAPSLAGWLIYLVDAYERRVSSLVRLQGIQGEKVTLVTAFSSATLAGLTLVVEPPEGAQALATFREGDVAGDIPRKVKYPALPQTVQVSGVVTAKADPGRPVAADLVFDAPDFGVLLADLTRDAPLSYRTRVSTRTDADHVGEYTVRLPPGQYRVYAIPKDAPDLALTLRDALVGTAPVQLGNGIPLEDRRHLRGRVVLPDGRPLVDASVVVSSTNDPYLKTPPTPPLPLPPVQARDVVSVTDASGSFDVLVDPGVMDISVRPAEGSRFPWVVTTALTVAAADVTLAQTIVIPVPTAQKSTVVDPLGNPIPGALIRAYAFPNPPVSGTPAPPSRAARLVGRTVTDAKGHYELYLAGAPD